jgi:hypothetical protein
MKLTDYDTNAKLKHKPMAKTILGMTDVPVYEYQIWLVQHLFKNEIKPVSESSTA